MGGLTVQLAIWSSYRYGIFSKWHNLTLEDIVLWCSGTRKGKSLVLMKSVQLHRQIWSSLSPM